MKLHQISTLEITAIIGLTLISIAESKADTYKQFNIFAGIGYHNESFDCKKHSGCFGGNDLGILKLKWKPAKYIAVELIHISNYHVQDMGLNAGFAGVDYSFDLY